MIEADHGSWTLGTTQGRCYRDGIRLHEHHTFVRSTGFHHFGEPFNFVIVPLPTSELSVAPIAAIKLPIVRFPVRPTTIAPIEEEFDDTDLEELSAVERAEEPIAAAVYIKGYDPPPATHPLADAIRRGDFDAFRTALDEQREREFRFASLQIEELHRTVFVRRDHIQRQRIRSVADLREAFSKGWRLNREQPIEWPPW